MIKPIIISLFFLLLSCAERNLDSDFSKYQLLMEKIYDSQLCPIIWRNTYTTGNFNPKVIDSLFLRKEKKLAKEMDSIGLSFELADTTSFDYSVLFYYKNNLKNKPERAFYDEVTKLNYKKVIVDTRYCNSINEIGFSFVSNKEFKTFPFKEEHFLRLREYLSNDLKITSYSFAKSNKFKKNPILHIRIASDGYDVFESNLDSLFIKKFSTFIQKRFKDELALHQDIVFYSKGNRKNFWLMQKNGVTIEGIPGQE